jgi:myosin heavy chain 6/7
MILAPNEMKAEPDERKAAKICLEKIALDPEWYRIGHTKARKSH